MAIPTLQELAIKGTSVALRYNVALNPILPSINRFVVMVNGRRVYGVGKANLSSDGKTILFELASPIAASDSVRITYGSVNGAEKSGFGEIRSLASGAPAAYSRNIAAIVLADAMPPSVIIRASKASLASGETATISFVFSRDPGLSFSWDGFSGSVSVEGGSLSPLVGDGLIRTATFTPTANSSGGAYVRVAAGAYRDVFGNLGSASSSAVINYDTQPPVLLISSDKVSLKAGEAATVNFAFSEQPSGFIPSVINTTGGTLTGLTLTADPKIYTATLTPTPGGSGIASIAVAAGRYTDAAGNAGAGSNVLALAYDTQAPTLAISSDQGSLKAGESATITFTFSEDPGTSFSWDGSSGDLSVSGGTLSAISGSGLIRTATFTPTPGSNGSARITVSAGSYTDAAGNLGSAGSSPSISYDTQPPTLVISSDKGTLNDGETATITFAFSELPSGFETSAIAITGGSLSALAVTADPKVFTAIFTPTSGSSGNASLSVAAGSYGDAAGNAGGAAAVQVALGPLPSLSADLTASTDTGTQMASRP
jgi:hypothetical protein